jgi:hypothetical protein
MKMSPKRVRRTGPTPSSPVTTQFVYKFGFAESVVRWMIKKSAIDPAFESSSGYFFVKERAARFENPSNLCNALLPIGHVV